MASSSERNLKVERSWGVGNFRQTAGFPIGENKLHEYVCPLGPSIATWNIEKKEIENFNQISSDLVVCLLKCGDKVLMISYSGKGKVLNLAFECLTEFEIPGGNVVYASWAKNGEMFCVCTTGPKSIVALYEIANGCKEVRLVWLKCAANTKEKNEIEHDNNCEKRENFQLSENECSSSQTSTNNDDKSLKTTFYNCYYGCIFTDNDTIFTVYHEPKKSCEGHLFSIDCQTLKKQPLSPFGEQDASMMCLSSCKNQHIAIGLQRGIFMFINSKTLEIKSIFQAQGSSQVCIWDNDDFLTASYQNGVLQWWSVNGELLKEVSITPIDSVIHLNWSVPGKELWIGGITSLNYICLGTVDEVTKAEKKFSLRLHRLAGCGLSYKNNNILATGDLSGNIMVWDKSCEIGISHPMSSINVKESVRSLCWCGDYLYIGTLNGDLFKWMFKGHNTEYTAVYRFAYGVLTIKKASDSEKIAIGTSGGDVFVFEISDGKLELKFTKQVHVPMPVSTGLEKQPMEIWSISWNPSDELLATASEDKTSIIIDTNDGHEIATLTGHVTAVTSIDWKETKSLGCLIATCADDRTVRISNGYSYELIKVLKTDNIYGWYTLTYININPIDNLILCSTQNGFIIIWDLVTNKCLVCERMHCGSIEGLSWDSSMTSFATIGSDCVANIFKLA